MTNDRKRGWWEEYREFLPSPLLDLAELEHHAKSSARRLTARIPGLLQTHDHAREIFRQAVTELSPPDIEHRVSFRIKRQNVLYRDDPTPYEADHPRGGPAHEVRRARPWPDSSSSTCST